MALRQRSYPKGDPTIAKTKWLLAGVLTKEKRYEEAEPLLLTSYVESTDKQHQQGAIDSLVELYDSWGKPAKADEWRKQVPRDSEWIWSHTIDPMLWMAEPDATLTQARQFAEAHEEDSDCWQMLGWALYRSGDYAGSVKALEKSMSLQKVTPLAVMRLQWFFLAMTTGQLGHAQEARDWDKKSVSWMDRNAPQNPDLLRMRAEAGTLISAPAATAPASQPQR